MAANDDFPRGCTIQNNVGANTTPSVVFPATPGIAWVLTDAQLLLYGATGADSEVITVNGTQYPVMAVAPGDAQWTGELMFPVGSAVTVSTTGSGSVNRFANLQASAYPI